MVRRFYDAWRENRRFAAARRKRSFMDRMTNIIVLVLILVIGFSYLHKYMASPKENQSTQMQSSSSVNSNNMTDEIVKDDIGDSKDVIVKGKNVFNFFHLNIIDIIVLTGAIAFYIYAKHYKKKTEEQEGE